MSAKIGTSKTAYTGSETGTTEIPANEGFILNATADLSVTFRDDDAAHTLSFTKNVHYPFDLKNVDVSNASTTVTVFVINGKNH